MTALGAAHFSTTTTFQSPPGFSGIVMILTICPGRAR
jgi:hypothetical protein